jgi:hypothetical protein
MDRLSNLEAWAILNGYDPAHSYADDDMSPPELPPGMLSPNFAQSEFQCTGTCANCVKNSAEHLPPPQLLEWLEDIRAHFGKPVNINSAYRCPKRNAEVGGASSSRHLEGDAADLWIKGVDPAEVYAYADKLIGGKGGVGKYETFTHIDARGYHARWTG